MSTQFFKISNFFLGIMLCMGVSLVSCSKNTCTCTVTTVDAQGVIVDQQTYKETNDPCSLGNSVSVFNGQTITRECE